MKRATRLGYAREKRAGMLMLAPFLILFFIFTVLPILSSVVLSFFTYDMISAPSFYGIGNYIKMLTGDDMFPKTLRNTLLFAIVTGPLGYLLSFGLAWMINELNRFLRTALSFLFYAPALAGQCVFNLAGAVQRGQLRLYQQSAIVAGTDHGAGSVAEKCGLYHAGCHAGAVVDEYGGIVSR